MRAVLELKVWKTSQLQQLSRVVVAWQGSDPQDMGMGALDQAGIECTREDREGD